MVCGSVWHCSLCVARIRARRYDELARLVEMHSAAEGLVWMTPYTSQHKKFNDPADLLWRFLEARRKMKMGCSGQALRRDFRVIGMLSGLEVTRCKENDWYLHDHGLVFSVDTDFALAKYDLVARAAGCEAAKESSGNNID